MDVNMFQSLVEKYSDMEAYPRMVGTGGGMDYIIVAKKPEVNLQLGVKPLITIGKTKTSVGFRLRSAPIPGGQVVPLLGSGEMPTQGYPSSGWAYPWEKVSDERASLVRMFTFERDASQIKHLWEDLSVHRFFGKLSSFLLEKSEPEQWHITPDELKEWMQAGFFTPVMQVQAQFDPNAKLAALKAKKASKNKGYDDEIAALEEEVAKLPPEDQQEYAPGKLETEDFIDPKSTAALMLGKVKPALASVPDAIVPQPNHQGHTLKAVDALDALPDDPEIDQPQTDDTGDEQEADAPKPGVEGLDDDNGGTLCDSDDELDKDD